VADLATTVVKYRGHYGGGKSEKLLRNPSPRLLVILGGAKNLVFSKSYRSFTPFRMTEKLVLQQLVGSSVRGAPALHQRHDSMTCVGKKFFIYGYSPGFSLCMPVGEATSRRLKVGHGYRDDIISSINYLSIVIPLL
jgi:hypothetical protein